MRPCGMVPQLWNLTFRSPAIELPASLVSGDLAVGQPGEISLPFDSVGSFLDHAITLEFLAQRRFCDERGTPSRALPESQWRGETVLNNQESKSGKAQGEFPRR